MPSERFFAYAERLLAYSGSLQARARMEDQEADAPAPSNSPPSSAGPRRPSTKVERDDAGNRIENGVAVDERGVPLWIKKKAAENGNSGEIDIIPGSAAALGFSPAFQGQFSYAQVESASHMNGKGVGDDESG